MICALKKKKKSKQITEWKLGKTLVLFSGLEA